MLAVAVFAGCSWYVKSFQTNLKKEVASFDGDAWQEAVKESGIEIVGNNNKLKEKETAVADEDKESIEVAETDTKPISKKEEKPKNPTKTEKKKNEKEKTEVKEAEVTLKKPCKGEVITACSLEELVFCETTNDWRTHNGTDFAGEEGDPIYATADGIVSRVYDDELLGTVLELDHKNGFLSVYGNIQNPDFMKAGTEVKQGDVVGGIGKSGTLEKNMSAHLHFELLKDGELVDPMKHITSN